MILSVFNSKGGVGKTTTAVNLAALWAHQGKRVLLCDCDAQFSATSVFLDTPISGATLRHVLTDDAPIEDAIRAVSPGLWVLPSDKGMEAAAAQLPHLKAADARLSRALKPVEGDFDVVILDCPAGFDAVARNALMAATHLLIPLNTERRAFDCAVDTHREADELRELYARPPLPLRIMLTAFRASTINARTIEAATRAQWPSDMAQTRVRHTEKVRELSSRNATVLGAGAGAAGEDYALLADELALWMAL